MSLNFFVLIGAMPGNVAQGLIWGIMAIGVFITYKLLNFADLSVDGSFATGGAVAVVLIASGLPVSVAMFIAFLAGLLAGLITGLLHVFLGIPDILSGILVQIGLYSINLQILGGANKAISVDKYNLIVSLRHVTESLLISMVFVGIIIAILYWYFGTEQGSAIRATGDNPAMSRAQGINIGWMKILALAISNALVGLSGALISQYQGFADVNMGRGAIVIGLAAVIIGEVIGNALIGKRMNFVIRLVFVAIGAIIYYAVIGVVLWLRMPTDYLRLFTAVIVAVFLAVPYLRDKAIESRIRSSNKGKGV